MSRDYVADVFKPLRGQGVGFSAMLGILAALVVAGLGAAHYMDINGHWVTGMNNHVVWGVPHVFAVFLIVVASGSLNVASMASVLGREHYKPLARVSVALATCLLAGGLAVLVLDLGRPDRLVVAMTAYNFSSVFTWNVFLYTGFLGLGAVYLWTMMDPSVRAWSKAAGTVALVWRFVLTSGTGFIFGFLVARDSYDAALLAPLFVMLSLSAGLASFVLCISLVGRFTGHGISDGLLTRLVRLLAQLAMVTLYFTLIMHVGNSYVAEQAGFSDFIVYGGGGYTTLYWVFFVLFGSLVPALIAWTPLAAARGLQLAACALVVLGAFALVYVIIIAGQAYPMDLMPGYEVVATTFADGEVAPYSASWPEIILGVGGVSFSLLMFVALAHVLPLFPALARSR